MINIVVIIAHILSTVATSMVIVEDFHQCIAVKDSRLLTLESVTLSAVNIRVKLVKINEPDIFQ